MDAGASQANGWSLVIRFFILFFLMASGPISADSLDPGLIRDWKKAISNDRVDTLADMLLAHRDPQLVLTRSDTGKTALMIACKLGELELVESLIKHGADVHTATKTGGTPFMFASLGGHLVVMEFLLARKVNIDAMGTNGWSAATIAAAKGYSDILSYLVAQGASLNTPDVYGWTPLMRAVDNRHIAAVRVLLKEPDINLDQQDEAGNTALHHAVKGGDPLMLELLLERGASRKIKNSAGFKPVQLAAALPNADKVLDLFSSD